MYQETISLHCYSLSRQSPVKKCTKKAIVERRFFIKKKERLLIGKRIHDGEISIGQCVEQRGFSREAAYRWLREYRASVGLKKPNQSSKPLEVSATASEAYESMGKPELIRKLMHRNIEARIGETTKKMNNIISAIEAGLDPTDLKSRYNELKGLRDELEHSLDEEKCRNPVMNVEEYQKNPEKMQGHFLEQPEGEKILINLLVNSIMIQDNGTIDIFYNYREREPKVPLSRLSSTTSLNCSTTIKKNSFDTRKCIKAFCFEFCIRQFN